MDTSDVKSVANKIVDEVQEKARSKLSQNGAQQQPTSTTCDSCLFSFINPDTWFHPERLNPKVEALVYWRDPKKSGIVFGSVLAVLLSLTLFSLISVVAYSSLIVLVAAISFRIYKNILQAVQKTSEGHPFKEYLELDLTLNPDKVREITDLAVVHVNTAINELRRRFLV